MTTPGTFVRKHSVQGAKWKPAYLSRLHEYVADVNYLTSHAYAFARFILLHEVDIEDSIIFQQFGSSFFMTFSYPVPNVRMSEKLEWRHKSDEL
ncbi:hypothetical protein GGH12_000175 [Coemansia sp. RSA 1822]|nr:hypothetical protein GGF49_000087 [Coemansia sp. RSA 1853]KAJ2567737.1 hypothetical protein GGH12_000175 [Coemansia sp. RSA 1822]